MVNLIEIVSLRNNLYKTSMLRGFIGSPLGRGDDEFFHKLANPESRLIPTVTNA